MLSSGFLFQNVSYILAFAALAVDVLAEARLRVTADSAGTACRRPPQLRALRRGVLLTCAMRFFVAYWLIFGDNEGGGEMFTHEGVLALFRSKGERWVVGLWMELCTLFVIAAVWMLDDDARAHGEGRKRLGVLALLLCLLLTFFFAGFGFVLYLLLRQQCGASTADEEEDTAAAAVAVAAVRQRRREREQVPVHALREHSE